MVKCDYPECDREDDDELKKFAGKQFHKKCLRKLRKKTRSAFGSGGDQIYKGMLGRGE